MFKKSQGFTLIELLMVIAIGVVITVLGIQEKMREVEEQQARAFGSEFAAYNNAVRSFISENAAALIAMDAPGGGPTILDTGQGAAWLKTAACTEGPGRIAGTGGPVGPAPAINWGVGLTTSNHLPCEFRDGPTMSGTMRWGDGRVAGTEIHADIDTSVIQVFTRMSPLKTGGTDRGDLAGLAISSARGFASQWFSPGAAATMATYGVNREINGDPPPHTNSQMARITGLVSNNTNNDAWLRTDGTNDMEADLAFNPVNPAAQRDIVNLNDAVGERFVDIDDNAFYVNPNERSEFNNLDVNTVRDNNNTSFVLNMDGTSRVFRMDATSQVRTPIIYDSNNVAFYLNPASNSVINDMTADIVTLERIVDINNAAFRLDMDGTSVLNNIYASVLFDRNNPAYFVDPAGTSVMNLIQVNDIAVMSRGGQLISRLLPNYVHIDSRMVSDYGRIARPTCIGGAPKVIVTPQRLRWYSGSGTSGYAESGQSNFQAYAETYSNYFRIRFYNQTTVGVMNTDARALASTYCYYP
jgi:prepilin-type N-terminal cleavage/methylation domain-containing protein